MARLLLSDTPSSRSICTREHPKSALLRAEQTRLVIELRTDTHMALPFFDSGSRKRPDQILAVDLGTRTTKAVHVQRRGEGFALCRYALLDAPIFEKTLSADLLSEHLRVVSQALDTKVKLLVLAMGLNDAVVRHVEMPRMSVEDMRLVLKHNSRNYLQQDLPNHVFDCHVAAPREGAKPADPVKAPAGQKQKTIVVG